MERELAANDDCEDIRTNPLNQLNPLSMSFLPFHRLMSESQTEEGNDRTESFLEQSPADAEPDAKLVRETIELAFVVAVQFLPPKQRAVFILRDVLDWSANKTADLFDSSRRESDARGGVVPAPRGRPVLRIRDGCASHRGW